MLASLAFGWLWHNESTVKTSSGLSATLSISVDNLSHRRRVFTWKERARGRVKYSISKREMSECLRACMPVSVSMMVQRETMAADS